MTEQSRVQMELVDRYILGQLNSDQCAELELRMLDDPDLLKEVQLREGLIQELKTSYASQSINEGHFGARQFDLSGQSFRRWLSQPLSIAASILVLVGSLFIFQSQIASYRRGMNDLSMTHIGHEVVLETVRGDNAPATIVDMSPVLFTIDVGPSQLESFDIYIQDVNSGEIATSLTDVIADDQGWIRVLIDNSLSGDYIVSVSSNYAGSVEARYPVTFVD